MEMRTLNQVILIFFACNQIKAFTASEEIVGVGFTAKFLHETTVLHNSQSLYQGRAILKVSRPDVDTVVISAQKFPKSNHENSLVLDAEGSLVLRTLQGRISSVLKPKQANFDWNLNYLRSMASIFFVYKDNYPHSYHMVTDLFGTCELTIMKNGTVTEVTRDLTRCSHASNEVTNSIHFLPLFHVGVDLSGSTSSCFYQWTDPSKQLLKEITCRDDFHVAQRFSQSSEIHLEVKSNIELKNQTPIEAEVYESISEATENTDLILEPFLSREKEVVENDELENVLNQLCSTSRDHLTKASLLLSADVFYALSRARNPPNVLKYPCPSNIRRSVAFSAALVGGPRFLSFVHDQMMLIVDEGLDLLPGFANPLITVAISNLAEPNLNPNYPVSSDFFLQRDNIYKMEKVMEMMLVAGSSGLPGVTNLLQKLRILSPNLFEDTVIRAAALITPEEACANGNAEEATRILHAVGALSVRPSSFVASLRPCFATEDVGVQVAAMMSLRTLDCDTPGVLELQQLALESPSDPEIRIAAFKGIVKCLPGRPSLIPSLQTLFDPDTENYSKQVSSFSWSYIQSVLSSTDPTLIDLRLELEDIPNIMNAPDPVYYDLRQHSRHLERNWILDPRTSLTGTLEFIWGRASPAPRSLLLRVTLYHDGVPYDVVEATLRFTGLERALWAIPGLRNSWNLMTQTTNNLWNTFQDTVEHFWRGKRQIDQNAVKAFVQEVIARVPADFQSSGSSVEISMSLFGIPVYHFHHGNIARFLHTFPETLSQLTISNFHSEIFHLFPFIDNNIEMGTSGGIPLSFRLASLNGIHSLMSHYKDQERGSIDLIISGGVVLETSMKVGRSTKHNKKATTDVIDPKEAVHDNFSDDFSDISTKYSWSIDLPVSFSYETKPKDIVMKFRRPAVLPHYLWQREKITFLNLKPFPMKLSERCMFDDESVKLCSEISENRRFADKLKVLNNFMLQPAFYGIKMAIPKGYEPVLVQLEGPEETPGRAVTTFRVQIPTERQTMNYEAVFLFDTTPVSSVAVTLTTPVHKYYLKGYWSFSTHEKWLFGVEVSLDEKLRELKFQVPFPKVANQRLVTPAVSITTPEKKEEEVVKAFIAIKDFPERSSIEFSGGTHGSLAEVIEIKLSGEMNKNRRELATDFTLEELTIKFPNGESINMKGAFSKTTAGIEISLYIMHGVDYELKTTFSYKLNDLGSSAHLLPAQVRATLSGATFNLNTLVKYPNIASPATLTISGSVKRGEIEFDINCQYGNETGRLLYFLVYESVWSFRSIASVAYPPGGIAWTATQELVWSDPDYKIGFNASWSLDPNDHFGVLFHFAKGNHYDHSLMAFVVVPGQQIKLSHEFSRAIAESYKHNFNLKMTPGREITLNTVVVAGKDPNVVTYGLSVDFKLDGWENVLRIVGTANCISTYTNCAINVVVSKGADQIGEFETKYTGSLAGISRTDIKLTVMDYLNLESFIDIVIKRGTIRFRLAGDVIPWERYVRGTITINWLSPDFGEAQFMALKSGDEEVATHYYNATLSINKEARTLFCRQELRADVSGSIELWAASIQGKIGDAVLNQKHFAKVALSTPTDNYYTMSGEASSEYIPWSLAIGNIVLSADIGANNTYLLGWDFTLRLKMDEAENKRHLTKDRGTNNPWEKELIIVTTLGRLKTPSTGEVKLNLKAKRSHIFDVDDPHFSNSAEVRLVTEAFPELGRLNAKLTYNSDAFSLSSRIWSGPKLLTIESYGVSREESLKGSASLAVTDPSSSWQIFEAGVEGDHLGKFPFNFESSMEITTKLRHENLGSLRALAQWTPSTAALKLGLETILKNVPGGQVFFKWTLSSFQSRIALLNLRTAFEIKWAERGRKLEYLFTFSLPQTYLNDIESSLNYHIKEGEVLLIPNILVLKGRLSVNTVNHWILDIDSKLKEKKIIVKGAMIRPHNPASFSVELVGLENGAYHGKATLVIDANSHHITVTLTPVDPGKELTVLIKSSLLPESNGYILRVWHKATDTYELGIMWTEGSDTSLWSHIYRLRAQPKYSKTDILEEIKVDDFYVYKENETDIVSNHLINILLLPEQNGQRYKIDIEFPEWLPGSYVAGTVHMLDDEKEITGFFRLELPDNDHIIESRLSYEGESITNWRFGRLIYRQRLIKGIGHPLRFEFEANKSYGEKKDFRFTLQKLFNKPKLSKGQPRSLKGGSGNKFVFKTFQGRLLILESTTSNEYKLGWETDDSRSEAQISMEKYSSGRGGHLSYERVLLRNPEVKEFSLLKGNFKKFPSEVTCSLTLEHFSIGRARSLAFLHSEAEAYTELVLDIFKSEEDQIIIVLNRKEDEHSFRVGQFGNNFLQFAHKIQNAEKQQTAHQSVLVEYGGQSVEIKVGTSDKQEDRECQWLHIVAGTSNLVPTYNTFTFCPRPNLELVIQVLGLEEKEGPYLRIGEISGPGGVGLQLGGGRLQPLDTPPALTLTGDIKEHVIEILFDCQVNSMNQFMEDFYSRKRVVEKASNKFPELQLEVKGTLAFDKALKDTERLLKDALQVLKPFKKEILESIDEEILEQVSKSTKIIYRWVDNKTEVAVKYLDGVVDATRKRLEETLFVCQKWIKQKETYVHEVVDYYTKDLRQFYDAEIWPVWIRIDGGIRAIRFNDNQSLYALVSRIMSSVHASLGRQKGISGFIVNDILTQAEQSVARRMRWENFKKDLLSLVHLLEKFTPINFKMSHDTAFTVQISPPSVLWSDLKIAVEEISVDDYLKYIQFIKSKFSEWKARFLYLKSWRVKGSATLIGWEQAISWDGRFLSPLLSDSCPHLLVVLTRSSEPIAITLHLSQDNYRVSKGLTFISRANKITVDSDLKVKINGNDLQNENEVIADLYVQKFPEKVRISSSEGIILECQAKADICIVEVARENFAATAGLLGVFDFETNTDFMTSAWERPASTPEWLSSWRIPSKDICQDVPFTRTPTEKQEETCSKLFLGKESPFNECLKLVSSKPYEAACRSGRRCSAEETMKRVCEEHFLETSDAQLTCGSPEVRFVLGSKIVGAEIAEGDDVYFECLANADPPVTRVEFLKDMNDIVRMNTSQGIVISHDTLVLQNIRPSITGIYSCRVTNSMGSSESNSLELKFKHKPVCAHDRKIIDAIEGEMVVLECKVKADPSEVAFSWSFSNGEEYIQLSKSTYSSFRLISRLKFVPKSKSDFGHVLCWAQNEMGTQSEPCEFTVNPLKISGACSEPPDERTGTEYLTQEIVFIGDFSCTDSIKNTIQILKKESKRQIRLVLRYTNADSLPDSYDEFDEVIASSEENGLDLISTSIRKDFSKDSLKAIVLLNCQSRECKSTNQADVDKTLSLSETMRETGIQLYTITKEPIVLNDPNNIPNKVKRQLLGMDRKTAYLMSHARKKNLKGKRGIRKHLSLPDKNLCTELSLQTDGAVFSLRVLKKLKKNSHKKVFKQLIAIRLLKGHDEEYFECRRCGCHTLCKLCNPIRPFESKILDFEKADNEAENDYFYQ